MANSDSGYTERIIADNGRQESSWLIGSIVVILLFAALTLQFNQQPVTVKANHLELDVTGKAVLTALRNAADEIRFLSDGTNFPSVAELQENALPPFADATGAFREYSWKKLSSDCYYGMSDGNSPDFLLRLDDHVEIYWRSAAAGTLNNCTQLNDWQTAPGHD